MFIRNEFREALAFAFSVSTVFILSQVFFNIIWMFHQEKASVILHIVLVDFGWDNILRIFKLIVCVNFKCRLFYLQYCLKSMYLSFTKEWICLVIHSLAFRDTYFLPRLCIETCSSNGITNVIMKGFKSCASWKDMRKNIPVNVF